MKAKSVKRKHLSINLHIFISMIAFSLVLIASLWLFQAMFLRIVFRAVKENTVTNISNDISSKIDDPNLGSYLESASGQYGDDISIAIVPISENFNEEFLYLYGNNVISTVNGEENKEMLTELMRFAYQSENHEYITGGDFEFIYVKLAGEFEDGTPTHMIIINTDSQPPALTKFAFQLLLLLIRFSDHVHLYRSGKIHRNLLFFYILQCCLPKLLHRCYQYVVFLMHKQWQWSYNIFLYS